MADKVRAISKSKSRRSYYRALKKYVDHALHVPTGSEENLLNNSVERKTGLDTGVGVGPFGDGRVSNVEVPAAVGLDGGMDLDSDGAADSYVVNQLPGSESSAHEDSDGKPLTSNSSGFSSDDPDISSEDIEGRSDDADISFVKGSTRTSESVSDDTLKDKLRKWAIQNNVPNLTLNSLLSILQPVIPEVGKDARTLLKVKLVTGVEPMGAGEFYYFGLSPTLLEMCKVRPKCHLLLLSFNVDGLPVFKSNGTSAWPILCRVTNLDFPPFPCAIWYGKEKAPLDEYFQYFVPELQQLVKCGLDVDGRVVSVKISNFICDAPAKAYIKGTSGHTSYHGCDRCCVVGEWYGRVTFQDICAPQRTHESFVKQWDEAHHTDVSPLLQLDIDLIAQFPYDYMHLVCLGSMKKILQWLLKGKKKVRRRILSEENAAIVNERLRKIKSFWPRDFNRKPRSLNELCWWKATELRQFLLYLIPVAFEGSVLPKEYVDLILLLHVAITCLSRDDLVSQYCGKARSILRKFVKRSCSLLGKQFLSHNIHALIHLADDCERYGKLDNFSSFPFENELQVLKKSIRGQIKPLHQMLNRILERNDALGLRSRQNEKKDGVLSKSAHSKGPKIQNPARFSVVKFVSERNAPSFTVPNGWIATDAGEPTCWWPTHLRGKKLDDAVTNCIIPNKAHKLWKSYRIVIKYPNGTQVKCNAKLQSYIDGNLTTGIDTEVGLSQEESCSSESEDDSVSQGSLKADNNSNGSSHDDDDNEDSGDNNDDGNENRDRLSPERQELNTKDKFQRKVLRDLAILRVEMRNLRAKIDTIAGIQAIQSGQDAVRGFTFPLDNPDKVRDLEEQLVRDSSLKNLKDFLVVKGSSLPTDWECASNVMEALFTDKCGYYFNYKGQRCKDGSIIAEDSKKIGLEKGMPKLASAISAAFKTICNAEKCKLTHSKLIAAAGRWFTKRTEKLKTTLKQDLPTLPWEWDSASGNGEGTNGDGNGNAS